MSEQAYLALDCNQLAAERARVEGTLADALQVQAGEAASDDAAMAVAVVLFTPVVLAIRGNRAMAAEVARLKGERRAIVSVQESKGCP